MTHPVQLVFPPFPLLIALIAGGCGSAPKPDPAAGSSALLGVTPSTIRKPAGNAAPAKLAGSAVSGGPDAASVPQPDAEPATPEVTFSPAGFHPPFPASASPEDGVWTQVGQALAGEVASAAPRVFRASVHPHPKSPFVRMDVAAIDLTQASLHWVIGTDDEGADKLMPHLTPGLINSADQEHTLAVFNGGFQARHGHWGMMSHGVEIVPPRDIGCTLLQTTDGQLRIAAWSLIKPDTEPANNTQQGTSPLDLRTVRYLRQGPPCLLHNDVVHPQLLKGQDKLWAGRNADLRTRRRSAVGLNAARTVLYYAVGTETEPVDLARGMLAIGASHALQLDINWNWTRFLIAGRREGVPRVTSTLIPDTAHGKNEYFSRPSQRDFFYVRVK